MKKKNIVFLFIAAALVAAIALYMGTNISTNETQEQTETASMKKSADDLTVSLEQAPGLEEQSDLLNSYEIGDADAPVTIVEYASFSCSHCANFHNDVLPGVKSQLVETGKARFIYRDFPLNGPALTASKLSHCVDQARYKGMVSMLFETQSNWLAQPAKIQESFLQMGRLAGLSEERFNECMNNKDVENAILLKMQNAREQYEIQSTPTFIFFASDGRIEKFSGVHPVEHFEETVSKLTD